MATLTFKTLKQWGMDTFCVRDYIGYIEDARKEDKRLGPVWGGERFAGMILYDGDTFETVDAFLHLCWEADVSIFRIDFSNMSGTPENKEFLKSLGEHIEYKVGEAYTDLKSYEFSFAYGLDSDSRGGVEEKFGFFSGAQVED